MLMKPNKNDAATIFVTKPGSKAPGEQHVEAPEVEGAVDTDQYTVAADEIISAMQSGNPRDLADTLRAFFDMCQSAEYSEE